jgi:hypothetical protein
MRIRVDEIAYHRNGVTGAGFHVILFHQRGLSCEMMAVVFEAPGHVAVFDKDVLNDDVVAFGENSWHGDEFESDLRKAIKKQEEKGK